MSQVPHSTQSSYVNCMRPLTNSKHFAGQELTHISCGQVSHTSGSTVMCWYSCASVTNFVAPRRALTLTTGILLSGETGLAAACSAECPDGEAITGSPPR